MLGLVEIKNRTIENENGCWEWQKCRDRQGYGISHKQMGTTRVHRIAYMLMYGEIPGEMLVLHKCDNASCCNPNHLELGSHSENQGQKAARKRSLLGERHPMARLTAEQALSIFNDARKQDVIASQYKITQAMVSRIKLGQAWSDVTGKTYCKAGPVYREKLTDEQVRMIRSSGLTLTEIARTHDIPSWVATKVLQRKTYRNVE